MATIVEQIIRPFLEKTPSKADIDAAEKLLEDAKRDQPAALVEQLFATLQRTDIPEAARSQSVVLLRKSLEKAEIEEGSLWKRLGSGQKVVQDKLIEILQTEQVGAVRRKVADCIRALGGQIININSDEKPWPNNIVAWPDLMPTLMQNIMNSSKASELRGDCLSIVKNLMFEIWPVMVTNGSQTLQVLAACLQDGSAEVCGNAIDVFLEMAEMIENKDDRSKLAPLIPDFVNALPKITSSTETLKKVLETFSDQTETPSFLSSVMVSSVVPFLCEVVAQHPSDDCKKLALTSIGQIISYDGNGCLSNAQCMGRILEVNVSAMLGNNLSDDLEEWGSLEDDDDELEGEELYRHGRTTINIICKAAMPEEGRSEDRKHIDMLLELLKPPLARLFEIGDWKSVVCAMTVFQQMVEYVDDEATVKQLLSAVQAQVKASHPRVRHTAWTCLIQFAEDHPDVLRDEAHISQIMTLFTEGLDDPVERVCCRCMESFQHFGGDIDRDDVEPCMKPMMQKLAPKLKGTPQLQQKAITSVAVLAGQVEDGFAEYYGDLMPYLKGIIGAASHKVEERQLLGKCFECVSLLAKAVGRKGFKQDAEVIMEAMIKTTQIPDLPSNDPVKEYMMAASSRICAVLKEDFLPMVPHVLPQILEKLTLSSPKEWGDLKAEDIKDDDEVTLTISRTPDGKQKIMIMNTSEMEDLENALQALHVFVNELGSHFSSFVADSAKALLAVFDFNIDENIRELAFEVWGELCKCAREAKDMGGLSQLILEFLNRIVPSFETSEDSFIDVDALKTKAEGLASILKQAGPNVLQQAQVEQLCSITMGVMMKSFKRREEFVAEKEKTKPSGDEKAVIEMQIETEESLREKIEEVGGSLMMHHPDAFVSCGLMPYLNVVEELKKSKHKEDRKMILYIGCDILHHLGARAVSHWDKFMFILLEDIVSTDASRRQAACYGISAAAEQPAFAPIALETAKKLESVVTQSRSRAKKKSEKIAQAAADNAMSGIVAILQAHKDALGNAQEELWNAWLQGLPCQEDEEEGQKNHKLLLKFVLEERVEVLKQGASNLPKVLAILVDQYKTAMVDDETNKGIQRLVLNLGQARLEQLAGGLSEKQKKKLLRVHREAASA